MMKPRTPAQLRNIVERFEEAVDAYSWRGASHPDAEPEIERRYHQRKALLLDCLGLQYVMPVEEDDD